MIRKIIFLSLLMFVLCIMGCGEDDSIVPVPNVPNSNITILEGWVYVVGNELLISDIALTSTTNKSLTASVKDNKPVKDCKVKVDDKEVKTDGNGHFEFEGLPEGEEDCFFDPSESEEAQQCPPVKENMPSKKKNQEEITYEWQNWRIQVVPRKRAQHVGVPKQYRINSWHLGKIADTPPGITLEWWYEYPDGSTSNGSTIDTNGIFTPTLPTNDKERVKVHVIVHDLEGNSLNDIVFEDPSYAYSEVKVLRGDGTDVGIVDGNVSKIYNYIVTGQTENIEGAIIALNGIDSIGITDQDGNYIINDVPPDQYQALMEFGTVTQNKDVVVEQPSTTLDFVITEDIIIDPTPTPTLLPEQPTPTTTPVPQTPTITPTSTPTPTRTPYWHEDKNHDSNTNWMDIEHLGDNNLWICGDQIIKSTDGGKNWTIKFTSASTTSIAILDSNTIIATSQNGYIYKTIDSGNNWNSIYTGTGATLMCNFFTGNLFGAVAGSNSQIRTTSDAGVNWGGSSVTGFTISIRDCEFISESIGFAGGTETGGVGGIHKTINGGINWAPMSIPSGTMGIYSMCFIGSNAWACGNQGTLIRSDDTGISWEDIDQSYTTLALNGIDMVDSQVGWAVGSGGVIFYTTDGGTTWVQQESYTTEILYEVIALSPDHAWAVGVNGTILEYY